MQAAEWQAGRDASGGAMAGWREDARLVDAGWRRCRMQHRRWKWIRKQEDKKGENPTYQQNEMVTNEQCMQEMQESQELKTLLN
ncbi:hypothetical protein AVEN_272706-1 [Araneus ventricosus]|uniref:Uncharacterized protein n=1 Tax=Araneus ventricosus TaxID=182803 RepID=A0A4Y2LB87_ARAVE|nr:hypothetical protein AVEN_272706-1 [Araneus ventricosus]